MRQSTTGLLLVVSGPAGVGKGTINAELMRRNPKIRMSVSVTTRDPRPGEIEGVRTGIGNPDGIPFFEIIADLDPG